MKRKRLHKLIDQLPDEAIDNAELILQDLLKYNTYIKRDKGLPVYDLGNPEHIKIIMERHTDNTKPRLSVLK